MPSLFVNSFGSQEKLKIQSGCRFGLERGPKPRVFQGCSPHPWSTQDSCAGGLVITSCWAGFDLVRVFFDATEGEHLPVVNVDYLPRKYSYPTVGFHDCLPALATDMVMRVQIPFPLKHSHLQPLIKATWRIIPVSKRLVTPIYKPFRPFGRGTSLVRGLINHGY